MAKNKVKIPKRIAGIKIKKKHRKAIGEVMAIVESPEVRGIVASLMGAFAGTRSKKTEPERPAVH